MLVALPSVKIFFAGQGAKDKLLTCFLSVGMEDVDVHGSVPVSYTHLTLPTSVAV